MPKRLWGRHHHSNTHSSRTEREGARKLVTRCLSLRKGEVLAVFGDETSAAVVETISSEAQQLGITVVTRLIPVAEQIHLSSEEQIGIQFEDRELVSGARAVLTCLAAEPMATAFRAQLVKIATDHGRRVGHMPGATLELLRTALNIDYDQANAVCADLALPLLKGNAAALRTYQYDKRGHLREECLLECGLGGFERPPITSTGEVPLGTWGNLPGGETFIAPIEETANGEFLLTGSFRGHVLEKGEAIRLEFQKGQLCNVRGPRALVDGFLKLIYAQKGQDDESINALAELGVGINPQLSRLTGISLLDEKCLGTAHIAIGHNAGYGGVLTSKIHEDFVTLSPSLLIDDLPVLDHGKLVVDRRDWLKPLSSLRPCPELLIDATVLRRTGVVTRTRGQEGLEIRREVAAGRVCLYTIGYRQDLPALTEVLDLIPRMPRRIHMGELRVAAEEKEIGSSTLRSALTLLLEHRVIAVHLAQGGE
jgi:aminopeptidase